MSLEIVTFYVAAIISVSATLLTITRANATHALIYFIISLLSVAVIFYLLGAPFAAALEIVIYAGAIVVLFLFVVMMLNLGRTAATLEQRWLAPRMWLWPSVMAAILLLEMLWLLSAGNSGHTTSGVPVPPKAVGIKLFGPYLLAVELAGILLLAALVGAFHLGRHYMAMRREERG